MTKRQTNTASVFGILAGLFSLPLHWMTFHDVTIGNQFFAEKFGKITVAINGLNGSVSFPFSTPLWMVVAFSIFANILLLMKSSKAYSVSIAWVWGTAFLSATWVTSILLLAYFSGKATFGIGAIFGLASAFLPLVGLALSYSDREFAESE